MEIGIFSRTYSGSMEGVFGAIHRNGLRHTQYNLLTSGMETMPDHINEKAIEETAAFAQMYGISLDALSGTFNMIAPDPLELEDGIARFRVLCRIAQMLKVPIISLCTGSKNPKSKWKWDDANLSPEAWHDLLKTTEKVLSFAQEYDLVLGVETEASNIINTPQRAREFLDTFGSKHLKIIMDGANLFLPEQIPQMRSVLEDAFGLLGKDIILAHAKDIAQGGDLEFVAAGEGVLDFEAYIDLLVRCGYKGPLILHGLSVEQVSGSIIFLKDVMQRA